MRKHRCGHFHNETERCCCLIGCSSRPPCCDEKPCQLKICSRPCCAKPICEKIVRDSGCLQCAISSCDGLSFFLIATGININTLNSDILLTLTDCKSVIHFPGEPDIGYLFWKIITPDCRLLLVIPETSQCNYPVGSAWNLVYRVCAG